FEIAVERQAMASDHGEPASGHFAPPQPATSLIEARATLRLDAPRFDLFGMDASAALSLSAMHDREDALAHFVTESGKGVGTFAATRTFSTGQLAISMLGGSHERNADSAAVSHRTRRSGNRTWLRFSLSRWRARWSGARRVA